MVGQVDRRNLSRIRVGQDFRDLARLHGDEAVDLQDREIGLVESRGRHRSRRDHRHLRTHAWVDDEVLAGSGCNRFRDLRNVRILEIRRDAAALLCGRDGDHRDQRRRAADQ